MPSASAPPPAPHPHQGPGRLLASGEHADVFEWRGDRILKIHRGADAHERAQAEATALALASHSHVVPLLEVVADPLGDGGPPGLALPRLSVRSAGQLLRDRGSVASGEAVTLLVPVLAAIQYLAGLPSAAHVDLVSGIKLDSVLLDEHGSPVLTGVRRAADTGPDRLRRPPGGADGAARRLVGEVLARAVGGDSDARRSLTVAVQAEATIDELVELLYDLAEPAAIDDDAPVTEVFIDRPPRSELDDLIPGLALLREWWAARHDAVDGPRLAQIARIRPRVWLLAGALGISAVLGPVLVGGSSPHPDQEDLRGAVADEAAEDDGHDGRPTVSDAAIPASPAVASAAPTPSASPSEADRSEADILTGDDAAAAASLLLTLRDACLAALDPECLRHVDEIGGDALHLDLAAVDEPVLLADLPHPVSGEVLASFGGVVLVETKDDNDEPASLLVTRTEAGWRLRSFASREALG